MSETDRPQIILPENVEPMFEANDLLGHPVKLRARLEQDGYLLLRGIIDSDKLQKLRDQITETLADLGWILGGTDRDLAKSVVMPLREGEDGYFAALDRIIKLEALHSMAHDDGLMSVMHMALGETAFPHPLSIARLVFPNHPEITTPPHQDYPNNQGTTKLTASWIPLGDCRREDGALAVLEGSNRAGLLPLQFHLGPGNRGSILNEDVLKLRWVSTDYKVGDILLFPSLTVHSALHNKHPHSMRLSVDFRYQLEGETLTEGCLKPHFNRVSWEEIYQDWESDRYQFYWKNKDFKVIPWDSTLHKLPEDHLIPAVKEGWAFDKTRVERHASNPLISKPLES
jgi:ectoine hydroxylase-related dioxygenase (phytanoyl-CoA dioxygenase family)